MVSGRTRFHWLCPSWGKAHVKRPWGTEMRGSGLCLSHSFILQDESKHRGLTALYSTCVLEVGVLLVLHLLSTSPCNFTEGTAVQINLPVLQNKVQNKSRAERYTRPCVLMKGEQSDWKFLLMSI